MYITTYFTAVYLDATHDIGENSRLKIDEEMHLNPLPNKF